jgi:hypothetical protein
MSSHPPRIAAFRAETERLERIVAARHAVQLNLDILHLLSPEEARIHAANQAAVPDLFAVMGGWPYQAPLNLTEKLTVLDAYAGRGDPLAVAARDYIHGLGYRRRDELLMAFDLPERMLRRTLTEDQYTGMLHGTLPLVASGRRRFYLGLAAFRESGDDDSGPAP